MKAKLIAYKGEESYQVDVFCSDVDLPALAELSYFISGMDPEMSSQNIPFEELRPYHLEISRRIIGKEACDRLDEAVKDLQPLTPEAAEAFASGAEVSGSFDEDLQQDLLENLGLDLVDAEKLFEPSSELTAWLEASRGMIAKYREDHDA